MRDFSKEQGEQMDWMDQNDNIYKCLQNRKDLSTIRDVSSI